MQVGMDIRPIASEEVFTSTLQSKSINLGNDTAKYIKKQRALHGHSVIEILPLNVKDLLRVRTEIMQDNIEVIQYFASVCQSQSSFSIVIRSDT